MSDTSFLELRSPRPSLMLRLAGWLIARRGSELDDPVALAENIPGRAPPQDAPMPASFRDRFDVEEQELEGQQVVTLHPKGATGRWHIIYFHGGGFFLPMFKEHWPLVAALVEATGASVSVPLYKVVPEHDHRPAEALADALFAHISKTWEPGRIALAGDSAGGNMAAALALRLRDAGGAMPGRLILFAPWLDVTLEDEAARKVEDDDIMLAVDPLRIMGGWWAGSRDPKDPQVSPLYADPTGLPPTAIFQGRDDIFVIDSHSYASNAASRGADIKLYEYQGAPHVFMAVTPTREAKDVFRLCDRFLKKGN